MKNLIIGGLLAFVLVSPVSASAQTAPVTNEQLLETINSLMKIVQDLMAKLVAIESQQTQDSAKIGSLKQEIISEVHIIAAPSPTPEEIQEILNRNELDKQARAMINDIGSDKLWNICRGTERAYDLVLARACVILGY